MPQKQKFFQTLPTVSEAVLDALLEVIEEERMRLYAAGLLELAELPSPSPEPPQDNPPPRIIE